ncbi:MAG: VOC family protein [Terriglobales bacterium]|jgi:catechol 2,3-dioxygenase-like lactoylglutathione lyase family enzyme
MNANLRRCMLLAAALLTVTSLTQAADPASPQAAAPVARPAIVGVAHIGLKTDNLEAARKFYTGVLGFQEPFSLDKTPDEGTGLLLTYFKVNDHQYIEMFPELTDPKMDRLSHISFETTDAEQMRAYLASRGVKVPEKLEPMQDGNRGFDVIDPDGHDVEFVEYRPGSLHSRNFGKFLPDTRISTRIIHVGVTVKDRAAADRFYKDILGFKLQWQGGMKDANTDWVAMRVPDGTDWLEYMLNVHNPDPHTLGVMHHLSLGVPSIQAGYKLALARGYTAKEKPQIGRDGKWQYNLYDPNFTRVELMEPKPVQKPCCSPIIE